MLYAIRKSDNKEFPVWKYIRNFSETHETKDPYIWVWCDEIGKVLIGEGYDLTYRPKGMYGIEWGFSFECYLIQVGIESEDYKFDEQTIFANVDYFRDCYNRHLSAYKALCFFGMFLEEKNEQNDKT